MAETHQGKLFFLLYLLFILASSLKISVASTSVSTQPEQEHHHHHATYHESGTESGNDSDTPQGLLLHRLEELVRNLSELVAKLESKLTELPDMVGLDKKENRELDKVDKKLADSAEEERFEGKAQDEERIRFTKYSPFWSERFQFVSAVKLDSDATCVNVLPFRDYEGHSKYVAVGDDRGRVYVFLKNGDVLVDFYTECDSPVTAIVSYFSVYKNESVVVTGHQNGAILVHKVYERSNGEDLSSLSMENVGKSASPTNGKECSAINILEVHHVGRLRYILSSDVNGKITVFRENGTIHGSAIPVSKPIAFLKQRLLFLTESGVGSLDLRTMKIRESECEGLNHSLARNYVFDATERSKAYGLTSEGDLIHVLLLGDVMNFKCKVRSKRKVDLDEPVVFQAIKGYLLIVNQETVFVYNVSSPHYVRPGGPRPLFSAGLEEIKLSFLSYQVMEEPSVKKKVIPLMASDREKLIVLGLGNGLVGIYRSNLPVFRGEFNTMLWTSPVLIFILFLFGAWQFFAKKKEALTSWGPDDPFSSTSAPTGAPLGSSTGDRSFVESSSRSANIMDIRSSGLRGPTRTYPSPSRYPGGATSSFRPSPVDANSRSVSVDPNYRAQPSELKYRGSTLEPAGFSKRRENLFINNQVDDGR
uniref:Putative membrane protein At1g75140-like n=1 Tax=Rhizophora mucronata TaxID=61149 RepID=A0A2P2J472_RHIMU